MSHLTGVIKRTGWGFHKDHMTVNTTLPINVNVLCHETRKKMFLFTFFLVYLPTHSRTFLCLSTQLKQLKKNLSLILKWNISLTFVPPSFFSPPPPSSCVSEAEKESPGLYVFFVRVGEKHSPNVMQVQPVEFTSCDTSSDKIHASN